MWLRTFACALLFAGAGLAQTPQAQTWRQILDARLHIYGQRNWIVVADSAWPLQSNPGVETIQSDEGHVETLRHVFEALSRMPHVRPVVYNDKELRFVTEEDAPGISAYRQLFGGLLEKYAPEQKPEVAYHDSLLHQIDENARVCNVLVIKTRMTLPYTSVFFELYNGYWTSEAERRLRQNMQP